MPKVAKFPSLANQLKDYAPLVRMRTVLEDIQALPGAKRHAFRNQRNGKAGLSQSGPYVRSHIVGTFDCVAIVLLVFRDEPLEEIAQIQRHIGIGVFLNDQRARSVLNEDCQNAVAYVLFGHPLFRGFCKWV